jgi:hypothetical protein
VEIEIVAGGAAEGLRPALSLPLRDQLVEVGAPVPCRMIGRFEIRRIFSFRACGRQPAQRIEMPLQLALNCGLADVSDG